LASRGRTGDWSSYRGNHLGQRSRTASTGRTYGCKRSDQTLKKLLWPGGRPHMGPGARPGRRRSVIAIQVSKCRDTPSPSRDTLRPSFANSFALKRKRAQRGPQKRARGRPGARCTRGLMCKGKQKNAHEHTGSAETLRPSLRNGFTAYSVLSPVRP
jgi:hypothetical protein